jgi:hypothetical protein
MDLQELRVLTSYKALKYLNIQYVLTQIVCHASCLYVYITTEVYGELRERAYIYIYTCIYIYVYVYIGCSYCQCLTDGVNTQTASKTNKTVWKKKSVDLHKLYAIS